MASESTAPLLPQQQQQLQMKDIYDLAQTVGEQFRQLLAKFGNTYLADHISTVVKALEYLETTFEENQRLLIKNSKLLLENDNLAREIRELSSNVKELHDFQEQHSKLQKEKMTLTLKLERLESKNCELISKVEVLGKLMKTPPASTPVAELTAAETHPLMKPDILSHAPRAPSPQLLSNGTTTMAPHLIEDCSNLDVLQVPRINHRLHMAEKELQQTQDRLTVMIKYNQELVKENSVIKLQLEEYRAEMALQTLEISHDHVVQHPSKEDAPRYYKKDLLAVLTERNELKEEVDRLSEELGITKAELRKYQVHSPTQPPASLYRIQTVRKPRSQTRVREILDSFTSVSASNSNPS